MIHREPAVIEDVYADPRIPHEAYRPTFVKSLAMVPVRSAAPVGAIGNYWARPHRVSDEDLGILQALADSTSVALENVRAYASLEESEARTKAIYDHLPSPTFVWQLRGEDFVLTTVNEAARAMTKAGAADLLGRSPADIPHGFPDLGRDLERCLRERVTVRRELSHAFSPSHQPRQVVATYGFVPPDMVLVHTDDVTEQRRTEEQLRLAQRMEAIGRLAGGVAHDFGNLLSVITSYAELALDGVRGIDPLHADIREIRKAAERATLLTRQLLAFGRKQLLSPRVLDLNQVVAEMEGMLRRLLGEDIDFATGLAPDLGRVKADPGQIEQVVMNLAVNARDAMPGGGKLTIDTTNVELDELYAGQHVSVKPGAYVLLSVSDTGCGMDDQIRTRLFEPFFTTKETGKGTGLGLATVYGIVKQSGGNIWVYSEPGKGTTFKVYLPREPAEATVETRLSRAVPRVTGDETILVVEDDEAVRNLARRVLASAGYTVVTAANGGEALLTCERYPGRIHLMLTDVVMPEMSGKDVAQRVAKLLPELRVLYMSGYTDRAIVHRGVLESGTHFVSKPFNAADLTGAVRAVLDEVLSEVAASAGTQSG
jgi:signal transduction histidine kinase/ActR/RegA family two-component response regulator